MSHKSNPPYIPTVAKKPRITRTYICPNSNCCRSFYQVKHFRQHISQSKECHIVVLKVLQSKEVQSIINRPKAGPTTRSASANAYTNTDIEDDILAVNDFVDISNEFVQEIEEDDDANVDMDSKPKASLITYTSGQYHETKLLQLLNDNNTPHYMYKEILKWAQAANLDNYNFTPQRWTRSSQIEYLKKWLQYDKICLPQQVKTLLPGEHGHEVDVTIFNFTSQLFSLLKDEELFGDIKNLDVDPKNPFGKYKSQKYLSTINSGELYETAYKNMVKDKEKTFSCQSFCM